MASYSNLSDAINWSSKYTADQFSPSLLTNTSWKTLAEHDIFGDGLILPSPWAARNSTWSGNVSRREPEDVKAHLRRLSDGAAFDLLPTFVFMALLVLLGIPGNAVVFLVYLKRFKPSSTRVYVLTMCAADLAINMLGLPTCVLFLRYLYDFPGPHLCRVIFVCARFPGAVSGWLLSFVAVDRYQRICSPFRKPQKEATAWCLALSSLVLASVLTFPFVSLYGTTSVPVEGIPSPGARCGTQDVYMKSPYRTFESIAFAVCAVVSLTIIVTSYVLIGRKLYVHAQDRQRSIGRQKRRKDNGDKTRSNRYHEASISITLDDSDPTDNVVDLPRSGLSNQSSDACESETECHSSGQSDRAPSDPGCNGHVATDVTWHSPIFKPNKKVGVSSLRNIGAKHSPLGARRLLSGSTDVCRQVVGERETCCAQSVSVSEKSTSPAHSPSIKSRLFHTFSSSTRSTLSSAGAARAAWTCSRTTLMLFVVTVVYLLSLLPYTVLSFQGDSRLTVCVNLSTYWPRNVCQISMMLFALNSSVNPFIYSFCNPRFRQQCRRLLTKERERRLEN